MVFERDIPSRNNVIIFSCCSSRSVHRSTTYVTILHKRAGGRRKAAPYAIAEALSASAAGCCPSHRLLPFSGRISFRHGKFFCSEGETLAGIRPRFKPLPLPPELEAVECLNV